MNHLQFTNRICSFLILFTAIPSFHALAEDHDRSFSITYRAEITEIPDTAQRVALWLPMPRSHRDQLVREINIQSSHRYQIVTDEAYKNRYVYIEIDGEEPVTALTEKPWISLDATITRKTIDALDTPFTMHNPEGELSRFLDPSALIPLDGPILAEAIKCVGEETDPLKQARLLYSHIVSTVRYDKSGDGWGRGDALYACDTRTGNCTDFHSLFIGQARSLEIPARFIMGFPVPTNASSGSITGYHCWAEFYTQDKGWAPIDASEAQKDSTRKQELFGGLDPNRIEFAIGRDIQLPKSELPPQNYTIYPHFEINGQKSEAVTWSLNYQDK